MAEAEAAVDFVLEKTMQLLNSESHSIHFEKDQVQSVHKGLQFLRQFLKDSGEKRNYHDERTKDAAVKIRDVAWEVDDTIDLVLLSTDLSHLRFNISEETEATRNYDGVSGHISELIDFFEAMGPQIREMLSSFSRKIVEGIRYVADNFIDDIEITKSGLMGIYDLLPTLSPHLAEKIRRSFDCVREEIDSIKTEVETWFDFDNLLLSSSQMPEREDFIISEKLQKSDDRLSYLYYRITTQYHFLSDLLSGLLKKVDSAVKILHSCDSFTEEMKVIEMKTAYYKKCLSLLERFSINYEEFHSRYGSIIIEMKSLKTGMEIYKRQSGRVGSVEIYKNGLSLLLLSPFLEAVYSYMEFIEKKIEIYRNVGDNRKLWSEGKSYTYFSELMAKKYGYELRDKRKFFYTKAEGKSYRYFAELMAVKDKDPSFLRVRDKHKFWYTKAEGKSYVYFSVLMAEKDNDPFFLMAEKGKDPFIHLSWKMVKLTGEMFDAFVDFIVGVNTEEREGCGLFRSNHMVDLLQKKFDFIAGFLERIAPVARKLVIYYKRGLESLTDGKIFCSFGGVLEEIESTRIEVMKIYEKMKMYDFQVLPVRKSSSRAPLVPANAVAGEETIVGFDDEKKKIKGFLTGDDGKQLEHIQIVGIPGLGKTTLARNVYCDPLIVHYFYIRAWTYVSQVCQKRELLLRILCSAFKLGDKIFDMSNEELADELYKRLKGMRYLIVLDDIWDIGVWNELKRCFPDDNNGSRIMFTSRLQVIDVAKSHQLRPLNYDESWILLKQRAFGKESCPPELFEIGKQIAKKCGGLPLAIVVLSGLLAKHEKTLPWWTHVAQSVSSYIATDQKQYMDTLALSYYHLPHHLKPCFLYFGAFPEDYEIPVWRLIWLWIAEGFISQHQPKRLEEVAEDYLRDLIDRNLVLVSKKKSNGGIKTCHIHDLLYELCLKKAQEENFLIQLCQYVQVSSSSLPSSLPINKQRRICVQSNHHIPSSWLFHRFPVRSFLSFYHSLDNLFTLDVPFVFPLFEFLRVLDLSYVRIFAFPVEITRLLHLRYLAFHVGELDYLKLPVANLWNLETLIINGGPRSLLGFDDFWKMANLRHFYAKQLIEIPHMPDDSCPFSLDKLQTVCKLDLRGLDGEFLRKIPHLRKLKCSFMESWGENHTFPNLKFLLHLENLNVMYDASNTLNTCPRRFPSIVEFPPNLKSLTLSNFRLPWEEMSTLEMLPNLEILKLSYKAFEGPRWDMGDMEFAKLKCLKLRSLDIKQWIASSNHFPMLQTLVLDGCKQLEEIPFDLVDIETLKIIQCCNCSASASNSAKQIEKQLIHGYDGLKICIHPYQYEVDESDHEDKNDAH